MRFLIDGPRQPATPSPPPVPGRRRGRAGRLALVLVALLCLPAPGPAAGSGEPADPGPARDTNLGWQAPVPGDLVRPALLPEQPWLPGHRGIDLAAAAGTAVVAPAPGTVTFAGQVAGRPVLVVSHGTLRSTFEPVDAVVAVGTTVAAGDQVGTVAASGSTHCLPASCVHWGVRRGEQYLDPAVLLGRAEPIVLLPSG